MDHQNNLDGFQYDLNQYQNPSSGDGAIFGNFDTGAQALPGSMAGNNYFGDLGDSVDENDPKRRRIARVCIDSRSLGIFY